MSLLVKYVGNFFGESSCSRLFTKDNIISFHQDLKIAAIPGDGIGKEVMPFTQ